MATVRTIDLPFEFNVAPLRRQGETFRLFSEPVGFYCRDVNKKDEPAEPKAPVPPYLTPTLGCNAVIVHLFSPMTARIAVQILTHEVLNSGIGVLMKRGLDPFGVALSSDISLGKRLLFRLVKIEPLLFPMVLQARRLNLFQPSSRKRPGGRLEVCLLCLGSDRSCL